MVVPLLPQKSGAAGARRRLRPPAMRSRPLPRSLMPMPSCAKATCMWRVSSAASTLVSSVSPAASAASTSARLVMLLEPGTRQVPSREPAGTGTIGSGPVGMGGGCWRRCRVGNERSAAQAHWRTLDARSDPEVACRMLDPAALRLGVRILDVQHERLIRLAGRLDAGTIDVPTVMAELRAYIDRHFVVEEELMAAYGCPDATAHTAAHDLFRSRVLAVDADSVAGSAALLTALRHFVEQWIAEHIQHTRSPSGRLPQGAGHLSALPIASPRTPATVPRHAPPRLRPAALRHRRARRRLLRAQ